MCSAKKACCS